MRLCRSTGGIGAIALIGSLVVMGCSRDSEVKEPEASYTGSYSETARFEEPASQAGEARASGEMPGEEGEIVVEEKLRVQCNLPNERQEGPRFDFDEAELRPRGQGILTGVASCMQAGALEGAPIVIVGHADPRGTEAYNERLGLRRAQAARDYLIERGVPAERIRVESRGEAAAQGQGEEGWQLDRRVEIRTAE